MRFFCRKVFAWRKKNIWEKHHYVFPDLIAKLSWKVLWGEGEILWNLASILSAQGIASTCLDMYLFILAINLASPHSISYFYHLLLLPPTRTLILTKHHLTCMSTLFILLWRNVASWGISLMFARVKTEAKVNTYPSTSLHKT